MGVPHALPGLGLTVAFVSHDRLDKAAHGVPIFVIERRVQGHR